MTTPALLAFTVSAVAWLLAVGLVLLPLWRNRAETRFSGPPDGQTGEPGPVTAAPLLNAPLAAVSRDPTPYARRSPFEHERDDAPLTWPGPVLPPLSSLQANVRSLAVAMLSEMRIASPARHPGAVLDQFRIAHGAAAELALAALLDKRLIGVDGDGRLYFPPSDAGLCGLARRDAMVAPDWPAFRAMRQRRDGEDFDPYDE